MRTEAERRVTAMRGSSDVPGFEVCVEAELSAMRRVSQSPAAGEAKPIWIDHAGDVCPVPTGTPVKVRYRDGGLSPVVPAQQDSGPKYRDAENCFWRWRNESGHHSDIVAFQIASPALAAQKATGR